MLAHTASCLCLSLLLPTLISSPNLSGGAPCFMGKVEPASAQCNVVPVGVMVPHYWEQVFLRSPPIRPPFRLSQFLSDGSSPPESCLLACKRALFLPSQKINK